MRHSSGDNHTTIARYASVNRIDSETKHRLRAEHESLDIIDLRLRLDVLLAHAKAPPPTGAKRSAWGLESTSEATAQAG